MKKFVGEFVGTFGLVFIGTWSILFAQYSNGTYGHNFVSLCWGGAVTAMILLMAGLSGAQMNPAVTVSLAAGKFFRWRSVPLYLIAQAGGAILASYCLHLLYPLDQNLGVTLPSGPALQSFTLEFFMTLGLMLVILYMPSGNFRRRIFAAVCIGLTVGMEAWFGGPISGASMNPFRSLAPAIVSGHLEHLWIYLTAPTAGALLAVFLRKFL
jgi:aquaporin Z